VVTPDGLPPMKFFDSHHMRKARRIWLNWARPGWQRLLQLPWQQASRRPGETIAEGNELYVFAESEARVAKERAMRQRQLKWLWARLKQLAEMDLSREELRARGDWSWSISGSRSAPY
jgi:hypothetical protein